MLANPEGVDTLGTFSALEPATETPPEQPVESTEETENPETTVETAPEPGLRPSDAEEPVTDSNPEPKKFKAKLDGKEIEFLVNDPDIDVEQLPSSLMMSHTFYKKTEELANDRKAFEEKAKEVDSQLEELRNQLDYGISQLESKEMQELKEDDPAAYWEKYGEIQSKHDKFKAFTEKRKQELQKEHNDLVQNEIKNWEVTIPEWQNPDVKKKEAGELYQYLVDDGFPPEMVGSIYDSKLMKHLRNSMLYEKASSKAIQSTKQPQKRVASNSTATTKAKEEIPIEQLFYGNGS